MPDWSAEIARALFACKKPEHAMLFIHISGVNLEEELDIRSKMTELMHRDLTLAFLYQVFDFILTF